MSQPKVLKPLRPAASLIINLSDQNSNRNKILTLVRKPHMSFANSVVFPGGVSQDIDKRYLHNADFEKFAKITAVRQTLQQTGILLLPSKAICQRLLQFKTMYKNRKLKEVEQYISKIWSQNLQQVIPLIRLVTPQIRAMSRFDCMFYTLSKQVQKINLGQSQNLEKLDIHIQQSNQYYWLQPKDYLLMSLKKELQLPPPQIIIFNVFNNVPLPRLKDLVQKQPLQIEPLYFQFNSKMEITALGDKDYNWKDYFQNEPESSQGKLIRDFLHSNYESKYKNVQNRRIKMSRPQTGLRATFIFQGTASEKTLLKYLPLQVVSSI